MEQAVLTHDPKLSPVTASAGPTRYARTSDDVEIAYRATTNGGDDIVFVLEWTSNVELQWELPGLRSFLSQLAAAGRLIAIQRRDTGVSGRTGGFTPPTGCLADVDAVLDEVGARSVSVVGWGHGGQVALAYAATRPERVRAVAAISSYTRLGRTADNPHGLPPDFLDAFLPHMRAVWGTPVPKAPIFHPDDANDPVLIERISRMERLTLTPDQAVEMQRIAWDFDIGPLLSDVACPTLVVALTESVTGRGNARTLADRLAGSRYLELPGHFVPTADQAAVLGRAIADFLAEI
jgi:pimeloyl-ACP methyl ester carboxylesterase